jgi:hypothetical protein
MLGYGLDSWVYTPAEAGLLSYPLRPNRCRGRLAEDMMKIHLHLEQKLSMLGVLTQPANTYLLYASQ